MLLTFPEEKILWPIIILCTTYRPSRPDLHQWINNHTKQYIVVHYYTLYYVGHHRLDLHD